MRLSGRGIRCVRGGREVFSGLDFEAASGEALAVTGPNGAGKTSLLRLIAGLLTMAGGSIGLEGGEGELQLDTLCQIIEGVSHFVYLAARLTFGTINLRILHHNTFSLHNCHPLAFNLPNISSFNLPLLSAKLPSSSHLPLRRNNPYSRKQVSLCATASRHKRMRPSR